MEDLLKEDDFVNKEYFNHWKYFSLFYLLAVVHMIFFYFVIDYAMASQVGSALYIFITILNIAFPLILAVWMIVNNKKAIVLPVNLIFLSLICLAGSYFVGMMLVSGIDVYLKGSGFKIEDVFIALGFCGFYLFLFSVIVIPVAIHKRKKSKVFIQ